MATLRSEKSDYLLATMALADKHKLKFKNDYASGYGVFMHTKFGDCKINMIGNYKKDYEDLLD